MDALLSLMVCHVVGETQVRQLFGGILLGWVIGIVTHRALFRIQDRLGETLVTVVALYLTYWLSEARVLQLGISGPLAVAAFAVYLVRPSVCPLGLASRPFFVIFWLRISIAFSVFATGCTSIRSARGALRRPVVVGRRWHNAEYACVRHGRSDVRAEGQFFLFPGEACRVVLRCCSHIFVLSQGMIHFSQHPGDMVWIIVLWCVALLTRLAVLATFRPLLNVVGPRLRYQDLLCITWMQNSGALAITLALFADDSAMFPAIMRLVVCCLADLTWLLVMCHHQLILFSEPHFAFVCV